MKDDIFSIPRNRLPFDPTDEQAVLRHAQKLKGKTIGALAAEVGNITQKGSVNKGDFGGTVERWFHLRPNQRQEPDLPDVVWSEGQGMGLEIKTLPIKRLKSDRFRSKERTVLTMIDFEALAKEQWATASVRGKMQRILFITYWHDPDDKASSTIQGAFLWSPPRSDFPQFEKDWKAVQQAVVAGDPERVSESLGRYLGACTKGSKDPRHRRLPNGKEAHPRAWALKASYTWTHVQAALDPRHFVQSTGTLVAQDPVLTLDAFDIQAQTGQTRLERLERAVLGLLHNLEGLTIGQACRKYEVDSTGKDKSRAARLMAKVIGTQEDQEIVELSAAGVHVKTMHFRDPEDAGPRKVPMIAFESMSFPQVDLLKMAQEDWDEDGIDFRDHIQRLLIIPTYSRSSNSKQTQRRIGRAFFWSPAPDQWDLIREDWLRMQELLRRGGVVYRQKRDRYGRPMWRKNKHGVQVPRRENDMPGNEKGRAAHMRPKAEDSSDETLEPTGRMVTKQCLWLNGWFVRDLLLASRGDAPESAGVTV